MHNIKLFVKNEKELNAIIQTIRIYTQHVGMEFGKEKCAQPIMKSGKGKITEGIEQSNQERIRIIGERETNQHFGTLEKDTIKQVEMKEKI